MIIATGMIFAFILCIALAFRNGGQDEKLKMSRKNEDAGHNAAMARDRILRDGDYAERVRKRFTR